MKKLLSLVLAMIMVFSLFGTAFAAEAPTLIAAKPPTVASGKVDKSTQPRIIITTDLEVDDENGMLLSLMFASDYDLAGIVWTAGMFHFNGDGEHTLAEICPNFKCEEPNAGELKECRPVDPSVLPNFFDLYEQDYPNLVKNNPNYPTPAYLRSIAKVGNIAFEGDYRYETEGSELIYNVIMDNDPRPVYIMHWGGINTTVRALMSIYEDYYGTPAWESVLKKVTDKVRISGNGEDNCRADSKIDELFPGLKNSDWSGFGGLGNYWQAILKGSGHPMPFVGTNETLNPYYQSEYLTKAFKFDHGALMGAFHLMGDGQYLKGEKDSMQYGLTTTMDWNMPDLFPAWTFDQYDWMGCQFGCNSFVDLGLRQDVTNSDDRYIVATWEEIAARADWAIDPDANHAPVIDAGTLDYYALPGETIKFPGTAADPDGDKVDLSWWIAKSGCTYANVDGLTVTDGAITVPADAKAGDKIVVNLQATDTGVERPMTRYAQYVVTVVDEISGKVDKSTQPRILITTDLECDDQNGLLLSLMFATDYDLAGIVWTAGKFHFSGDGVHTLEEITPNWSCEGNTAGGTVENAGQLKEFRPVDPGMLDHICDLYEQDYPNLVANNPNYPTPEYIRSISKEGNIQFEGDYRYETEGSQLIYDVIMDDDPRPVYIMHWGGINTTVRALMSIYEDYHDTDEWETVLKKVTDKVRLSGSGEDNCRADSKIDELFPGLKNSDWSGFGGLGNYFQATVQGTHPGLPFIGTNPTLNPYYQAEYLTQAFKLDHGALMGEFLLYGDGQRIYGEPDIYQYGLITYIDWVEAGKQGWAGTANTPFTRIDYDQYDWCCCQFGCNSFVDLGLRQDVKNSDDRYIIATWDEIAARADWAIDPDGNHAPVITADKLDHTVTAGGSITLEGTAIDPDGDGVKTNWWVLNSGTSYAGAETLTVDKGTITVPADAVAGDKIVVNMEVTDIGVERPMTRYAQYVITVAEAEKPVEPVEPEPEVVTHTVAAGENLSSIAAKYYGSRLEWRVIFDANTATIKNPNLIFVGQKLIIPNK